MTAASRRCFLCAAAPAALAGLTAGEVDAGDRRRRLTAIFANRQASRDLGRAVWRTLPAETTEESLIAALLDRNPEVADLIAGGAPDQLAAALRRAVEADFAHGRTHRVDGWVLSRTEAELCALARLA